MILDDIFNELTIHVNTQGMSIKQMSGNEKIIFFLNIDKKSFETFECQSDLSVSVSTKEMIKFLKLVKTKDSLSFIFENKNFSMEIENENSNKTYDISLIDIPILKLEIPKLEYTNIANLDNKLFSQTIKTLNNFGETIVLNMSNGDFKLKSEKLNININTNKIQNNENVSMSFDCYDLCCLKNLYFLNENVDIYMSKEKPLVSSCEFINSKIVILILTT